MNEIIRNDLQKWERFIAFIAAAFTPLVISITTYDSYLLPKIVWLTFCAAIWLLLIVYQPLPRSHFRNPLNKPLAALFLISLVSVVINYRTPIQLRALLNLVLFIGLFYGYQRFWRMGGNPLHLIRVLMAAACFIALYGILQDYGVDFAVTTGGVRDWRAKVISTLGNPNFLAGYLDILLPVAVGYGLRKETRIGGFLAVCVTVLLIAACHTCTFSVGGAMGLLGALLVTLSGAIALQGRIRIPVFRAIVLAALAASAVGWYMLENPYNSHGRSLYRQAWESSHWWSGMGSRRFNWQTTRIMIEERPVTGVGFGNYLTVHEHYQGINYKNQWHAHDRDYVVPVDQPHFQLLETAAEIGPLGVFVLFWLFMAWMKSAARTLRRSPHPWFAWGAYAGLWMAAIHSTADFPFHLPASTLLIIILGSYFTVHPQPESTPKPLPAWIKTGFAAIAFLFFVNAFTLFLGNRYLRLGYESEGLDSIYYLDRSRSYDPWSHETYYLLGARYAEQGWNRQAIAAFQKAILYQEDILSHKWLARIYQNQGNREAAIHELERIIEINPVFPGHYRDLIAYLGNSGDPETIKKLDTLAGQLEEQMKTRK